MTNQSKAEKIRILKKHWNLNSEDALTLESLISLDEQCQPTLLISNSLLKCAILLDILYGETLSREWMKLPNQNKLFGGRSPLQFISYGGASAVEKLLQLLNSRVS